MKYRLREKFKNTKLSGKMMLVYIFFAGISCCISIVALQASLNIYDKKLYEKSLQELDFFTQKVNDSLDEAENLSYNIAMDSDIQEQLERAEAFPYLSADYMYEMYRFRGMLQEMLPPYSIVKNIIYTDGKKQQYQVGTACGNISGAAWTKLLEQFRVKKGGYVCQSPTDGYPYILSGRDILERKNASLDYMGSLILTSDIAGMLEEKKDSLQASQAALFVYSEEGMIYQEETDEMPKLPAADEEQGYQIIQHKGQKYFMCYLKSSLNGWMYVNMFPYSEIFGQTMLVRYLMLGGFLLVFFLTMLAMRKISNIITKPLEQLTQSMRIVEEGDFQGAKVLLEGEKRDDETGLLTQEFQVMLDRIDALIHENYEKQLLLKDTKYKMLQAQINPHFLYNTLNALNWMVRAERNQDAGKMIMELGQLLRASFARDPYTSVAEEVRTAGSYITIQQFRYQKRAEFEVRTVGNLEHYLIPRMIIQPLIENAIYYGVEQSLTGCRITVHVIEGEDSIWLSVEDTGPGMSPEELEDVRNFTVKPKGHGIGLKNIRERLNITYDDSQFEIDSEPGRGTRITIRIPKVQKEEPDVQTSDCR